MKHYNPTKLVLNMPVMYNEADSQDSLMISGHYAYTDEDGYPHVFEEGGTSYTRNSRQVVKCKYAFPMTDAQYEVKRTAAMLDGILEDFVDSTSEQELQLEDGRVYVTRGNQIVYITRTNTNSKFNCFRGEIKVNKHKRLVNYNEDGKIYENYGNNHLLDDIVNPAVVKCT